MMPMTMGGILSRTGSTIASFMFMWAIIQRYLPSWLQSYVDKCSRRMFTFANPYNTVSIHESTGDRLRRSEAYSNVDAYLSANSSKNAKRLKAETSEKNKVVLSMDDNERVIDEFRGIKVWWSLNKTGSFTGSMFHPPEPEKRHYKLSFHKKHRQLVTDSYLKHVMDNGKAIKAKKRQRKLFTNSPGQRWSSYQHTVWSHIDFKHPASFDTFAMNPEKKREIIDDLLNFSKSKAYYAKIGKAWKRGYLLYGPPGTGKSTIIAAIAKLLDYDVYDLELTAVKDNTELRKLLIEVSNKSILVIEDIDCSLDLTGQRKQTIQKLQDDEKGKNNLVPRETRDENSSSKVTLSGLLNFIDGLWSACGGERLIVFTTNYMEKLDPALIRRGRMDKYIELSYCCFEQFKVLAQNYLDLESHPLFKVIHQLLVDTNITPADVAENLMPKSVSDNAETCLSNLIQALEEAKEEATKLKAMEKFKDEELPE